MLPTNSPFLPCPYCSIHMASLWLSVLQEASLNMHTHSKVSNWSSQTQSFISRECLPLSQILGSEPKDLSRGVCWEKWGLGQFLVLALLQTLMNVPMRRCVGATASVRTRMAPSAASVTVATRAHLLGTTALVSLPGSLCQAGKESHWQMPGQRPCCMMAPDHRQGLHLHIENHTHGQGSSWSQNPFPYHSRSLVLQRTRL